MFSSSVRIFVVAENIMFLEVSAQFQLNLLPYNHFAGKNVFLQFSQFTPLPLSNSTGGVKMQDQSPSEKRKHLYFRLFRYFKYAPRHHCDLGELIPLQCIYDIFCVFLFPFLVNSIFWLVNNLRAYCILPSGVDF